MFAVRTSILRQVVARCQRYRHASAMSFLSLWVHRTDSFRVWLCLLHYALWQYRLWSFQGRDTKLERVLAKINIHKGNHWILKIGLVASCQKLGIILENKVIWKLMLSKKVNNKNVLLNSYSSVKKIRKIPMIFDIENLLWKSNFGTFRHFTANIYDQITMEL